MKVLLKVYCFILTSVFISPISAAEDVSIISLIATPEQYENKELVVYGVVGVAHGESNLYLDPWSFDRFIKTNSICIQIKREDEDFKYFHSSPAIVYGLFEKHEYCGHILVVKNIGASISRKQMSKSLEKEKNDS